MAKKRRKKAKNQPPITPDFQAILNLPERLARFLRAWFHVPKSEWDFMLDVMRQPEHAYKEWSVSKGNGKTRRHFAAPCDEIKSVQTRVLQHFLNQVNVHCCRHGVIGTSIVSNAVSHMGHAHVYSVDIIAAFPTVRRSRVRANLEKPFRYGLRQFGGVKFEETDIKQMLESVVDLLVWKDRLPQGPPTSPQVFAIVCYRLDAKLWQLCYEFSTVMAEFRYSAYADDLTVSSSHTISEEMQEMVRDIVSDYGFLCHTNPDKSKYYAPETGEVPVVTGLVVSEDHVTIKPSKVNQIRGRLHRLNQIQLWSEEELGEVRGLLGFVHQIYGFSPPAKLKGPVKAACDRIEALKNGAPVTIVVEVTEEAIG